MKNQEETMVSRSSRMVPGFERVGLTVSALPEPCEKGRKPAVNVLFNNMITSCYAFTEHDVTATSEQKQETNKARELATSIASSRASIPRGASPVFRATRALF
jgi:hypothetical protein